jgi:NAD-dependent dihydropyrimidine dehydrogenase PreA subunit
MYNAYLDTSLVYDPKLCNGCGMCVAVCPHAVYVMDGRLARLVRPSACMECGACQLNCVTNAIQVESGVGCASAMIQAALTGKKEVTCGPDSACCQ